MQTGSLGAWYGADKLEPGQWIDLVTTVERLGYDTQWYSEAMGFESMAFGSFLLANTPRLKIGSSIANIYARDAVASRNRATDLESCLERPLHPGPRRLARTPGGEFSWPRLWQAGGYHAPLPRTDARRTARCRYAAGGHRGAGAAHAGTGRRVDTRGHSLQRDPGTHRPRRVPFLAPTSGWQWNRNSAWRAIPPRRWIWRTGNCPATWCCRTTITTGGASASASRTCRTAATPAS